MYKPKIIVHGHWIYNDDDGWRLAIYPIATVTPPSDEPNMLTSMVIAKDIDDSNLGNPCDAIEKIFTSDPNEVKSMTMYNFGSFDDNGEEYDLFLITPVANMKDTMVHPAITKEGYMFVEDLGIGVTPEEDEPLDSFLHDCLDRLEAPHQITFQ